MKKILLWTFTLSVLIFITGCSINIERNQDTMTQEQISWLEQRIKELETENTKLKNTAPIIQPKKTTIPTQPKEMDNCPNGDETISRYDWKCCDWNQIIIDGKCGYSKA